MRKHELDVLSLVLGLFFVGGALIWGLADSMDDPIGSWPLPTLLITVGVIGLVTSLLRRRGQHD
ncbi:MAG TPA: hypothetical protein VI357_06775 [Mycobacteriales bacterium]